MKYHHGGDVLKKLRLGILLFIALVALVSLASADTATLTFQHTTTPGAYWDIDVSSGSTLLPPGLDYPGWCANMNIPVSSGTTWVFTVFDSRNTASYGASWPSTIPNNQQAWNKINYVINHRTTSLGTADWKTVQAVIWYYLNYGPPFHGSIAGYDEAQYAKLIENADPHGDYKPYCKEVFAVVLYKDGIQGIVAQVTVPTLGCTNPPPNVPEFPTVALPAGMLVGMVGLVYYVRGREN